MTSKASKLVIYDFDGVIADSLPVSYRGVQAVFRFCDKEVPPLATFCHWFVGSFEEAYRRLGIELSSKELREIHNQGVGDFSPVPIFGDFLPVVMELKKQNIPAFLLSSNLPERVMRIIRRERLEAYFSKIMTGQEKKVEALRLIASAFNLKPQKVLFVGDMVSDMEDGRRAGVFPIGFVRGYGSPELLINAGAQAVISAHASILDIA